MEQSFDQFGNSLTEVTKVGDIPFILQRVKDLVIHTNPGQACTNLNYVYIIFSL